MHDSSCRSEFEGILEKTPQEANAFLADPEKYLHCESLHYVIALRGI